MPDAPQVVAERDADEAPPTARKPRTFRALLSAARMRSGQASKFLIVGGLVFFFDAAMYNLLVFWDPAAGWGTGVMHAHPVTAKVLTIATASVLTYVGNRLWTFNDRPAPRTVRSVVMFVLVNLVASGLQLSCLGFSRYVLGLDSVLADNVSGTLVGQIVSTSFRYVTYGRWVFPKSR